MKKIIRKILNRYGYDIIKTQTSHLPDYNEFIEIYNECKKYTMTSIERMYALYKSVEYIVKHDIKGDFIECGVWKGGSAMLVAKTLSKFNVTDRRIFLFDTFEGMNEPTENDKNVNGDSARELMDKSDIQDASSVWCYASLTEVQDNMLTTKYPSDNVIYVKGKVEDTLPVFTVPDEIAILRLDTDWYESTKLEMEYLFPSLQASGVLIIDDYGYWEGSRKAIDEYLDHHKVKILLNSIDDTGRIAVKTA